jgi:hypothetical protein
VHDKAEGEVGRGGGWLAAVHDKRGACGGGRGERQWWRAVDGSDDLQGRAAAAVVEGGRHKEFKREEEE